MSNTIRTPHRYTMNLPGTFEIHDVQGRWFGTFTEFKAAEATTDLLNRRHPEGGYDWTRVK
ncbi:hypothetical protein [Streptantibioticus silvisoli]|uniref:DUF2188 domain-containing protein n=1 Tax=Streptantibioticus silvisoli TaxID=2705255 RepID=A0ABT6W8G9_9ACTN|nr:hypothetical protein [Streptantibioticus silvisoli]MDI5965781.1 hypothetical protein [Streptantibioticus silvisoli]